MSGILSPTPKHQKSIDCGNQIKSSQGYGEVSLVQKYLEDAHETRSVKTEASDSALGTQAAVSEIETEEISGKFTQTLAL